MSFNECMFRENAIMRQQKCSEIRQTYNFLHEWNQTNLWKNANQRFTI